MLDYTFSYADLEYFLLILVRVASFIFATPFFSMTNTPRNVRIALSFFVAILLYPVVQGERIVYDTLTGYFVIVMKEALTGLLIGFAANLSFSVVAFAGHIADMEMGFSMATLFDPATKQNTSITGIYYNYTIMLMLIISGMHQYLLKALAETYTLIPMNGAIFRSDRLMASMLEFMANYIIIGFRICLPIFAVMTILNAVLGVLAKVSPQMNMFAVGMQMKVLVGLSILFLSTSMLPSAANFIYGQMQYMVSAFAQVMMP